jgi:hypothetical protein
VALVHSAPPTPGLAFTEVWSEPWRPVVSAAHPHARGDPADLRALSGDPLVLVARDGAAGMREQFVALCRGAGFEPTLGATYEDLSDALVEIARSTAWTFLRASNARHLEHLGIVALAVRDQLAPAALWLAHRTEPAPAARSLLALAARLHRAGELLPPPGDAGGLEE